MVVSVCCDCRKIVSLSKVSGGHTSRLIYVAFFIIFFFFFFFPFLFKVVSVGAFKLWLYEVLMVGSSICSRGDTCL